MMERGMRVRVLRCPCGKVHVATGITQTTECTCGEQLWSLLWDGTAR